MIAVDTCMRFGLSRKVLAPKFHCGIKIFMNFVDLEKLWPHCGIKNRDVVNNGRSRHLNECKFP